MEERWDIYDKNKQLTGRTMKRNDWTLKDDEYHLTVLGVIRRSDGKFLITKRVMTKACETAQWKVPRSPKPPPGRASDSVSKGIPRQALR